MMWSVPCVVTVESYSPSVAEAALSQGKGLANVVFSPAQLNLDKE